MTAGEVDLVDPTGGRRTVGTPAPRLGAGRPATVALVDAMLHKRGLWGRGMLDAVGAVLAARLPWVAVQRIDLDPITPEDPDVWATAMAPRYQALVIAAGD